ncbi:ribosomal-protein-alanine N-acetyltransferase [Asaia sp. W19]|uniref:ribosomal protein S18-alanine N-acetyltransferase n=1 Tax=unclassified Asaia TaxID=2685023 RepID=UPI000F8F5FA2|nr:ribosomal protein S18-alanine N-acetyltransferase [Asaia sp. W19]RUT25008.1 ribosomal-protein-alanine N-acetyltransferase [Asaia sp. W19]
MTALRIEPARPCHAAVCSAVHEACFPEAERWTRDAFHALLGTPGALGWLSLDGDQPRGLILVRQAGDEAEILTLGVHPACRRQGLARALLDHAVAFLAQRAVEALFLEVSTTNGAALALYACCGFRSCGLRKRYYPDGSDAQVLRHDLTSVIL